MSFINFIQEARFSGQPDQNQGQVVSASALQVVASRGEINTLIGGAANSGNVKQNGRHRFYIGSKPVSELRVCYPGWWVSDTLGEQDAPNNCRMAASIEIGGVVKRFKFGGENDGTLVAGSNWLQSDAFLPSEFGLEEFAAGQEFWIKSEREVAVGERFMYHQTPSYTVPTTGETYYVGATGATSKLDVAGALGTSGGWSVQSHVWLPLMILGRPVDGVAMMAVAVMGDSQANGDGGGSGDGTGASAGGIFRRGLLNVDGLKIARVNLARSSETAGQLSDSNEHRLAVLPYVNHIELVTGGNDYSGGSSVGATITNFAQIRGLIKAANPDAPLSQYELVAKTNSTDTWDTVANQTPRTGYEMGGAWRDVANAALEAAESVTDLDKFVSFAPGVYTDVTQWDRFKADHTGDGTHLNSTGQNAVQAANAAHLSELRTAYEGAV